MTEKLKVIDLFCGAGGSSYGARNAGVQIVAGFDMWGPAIQTYKANFPQAKVFQSDITAYSSKDIREIKAVLGQIDIILASPECTNHSRAKGAADKSEESRRTALEVVKFTTVFSPKWIIVENVVEMQSWHRYDELLTTLRQLKYQVTPVVLNAVAFGVPQSRKRLFILCSSSGEINIPTPTQDVIKPAQSIIDTSGKYNFSLVKKKGRAERTIQSVERAIAALGSKTPFLLIYYGSARNSNGGWQSIEEPLRTITTLDRFAYVTPGSKGHLMRMLQPEELKLAMGFKSDFQLSKVNGLTRRNRIKLMGNGVCPPVMQAIVESLTSNS